MYFEAIKFFKAKAALCEPFGELRRRKTLDDLCKIVEEHQPDLLPNLREGNAFNSDIVGVIDKAEPEVRKMLVERFFKYNFDSGYYSQISSLATRRTIAELDIEVDGHDLYDRSMRAEDYLGASMIARNLKLGKKLEYRATMLAVGREFKKIGNSEGSKSTDRYVADRYICNLRCLYNEMRFGPGFKNPIGKKVAKAYFNVLKEKGLNPAALSIAKEAGLGEDFIAKAKESLGKRALNFLKFLCRAGC